MHEQNKNGELPDTQPAPWHIVFTDGEELVIEGYDVDGVINEYRRRATLAYRYRGNPDDPTALEGNQHQHLYEFEDKHGEPIAVAKGSLVAELITQGLTVWPPTPK